MMATSTPSLTEHPDATTLAGTVANALSEAIQRGVATRGEAWLALAGGSTPFAAYRQLAAMPLPWPKVHLIATDERWVPEAHAKRNERALREAFAAAEGITVHPLVPNDAAGSENTYTADTSLQRVATQPLDGVLLGMGLDAHIASLFPTVTPAAALGIGDARSAITVTPDPLPPEAPFARVSLTLSRLLDSQQILLMINGTPKRDVLAAACTRSANEAPVRALLDAAPHLSIHWSP